MSHAPEYLQYIKVIGDPAYPDCELVVQLSDGGAMMPIKPGMSAENVIAGLRLLADMLEKGVEDRFEGVR